MDIVIIGAGASGLVAARELSKKGKKVIIVEARGRAGGRIHTLNDKRFDLPVETGAEFIHGDLFYTKELLKEAGIPFTKIGGSLYRAKDGQLFEQHEFIEYEEELMHQLKSLQEDMTVKDFLDTYFPGAKYEMLRKSLTSFVEGYDAADADHASCFALLQELLGEDSENQYRITGGYTRLIDWLVHECKQAGCELHLSTVVSSIKWSSGEVLVTTTDNRSFTAAQVLITVPVAVLQASPGQLGHITISPLPAPVENAIHVLGSTGVIKCILQFEEDFWNKAVVMESSGDVGFLFADTTVPTWWTQYPNKNGMITGWLAGPSSLQFKESTEEELLSQALQSLAILFHKDATEIRRLLKGYHIFNWTSDPFTRGAYVYEKLASKHAKRILNTPLENTLCFAGEGVYEGEQRGTVEGALLSGREAAAKLAGTSR